jgi:hypothetical protein
MDGISVSNDSAISVATAGTYQLILTNSFGCMDSLEAVSVIVNPLPAAAIDSNGSLTFCAGDSVMLASAGLEVPALPENVRAIVLGVGIMAVAYTYRRTWLNFKTNVTRPTGRASC